MHKYAVIEKAVGETPLQAIERFRQGRTQLEGVPLSYAGRLDPMASGKLLVLIGDECKKQGSYHGLDKSYTFSVLFGVGSDTQDVLGRLSLGEPVHPEKAALEHTAHTLRGTLSLPYPHFSSKTVQGKPLHTWTLEGRLNEIEIPARESRVYTLTCTEYTTKTTEEIYQEVLAKINRVPAVTEASKALGADFRRVDVRADWELWRKTFPGAQWSIATFDCTASSGTYMRSLAKLIGEHFNTPALAYSIQRTDIGRFQPLPFGGGFWHKRL